MKDLLCFRDTCNVYVVRDGDKAIAIDFGSGKWLSKLPGVKLEHVFLTQDDLTPKKSWPFQVHSSKRDMTAFGDLFWNRRRLSFIATPSGDPRALSIVLTHQGKQIVFCGDAAHSGATVWQPYRLEWDHWTGTGALAAWEGICRLANLHIDLLCPAHGPVIEKNPRQMLRQLAGKLLAFYHAKGSICPGERDYYVEPEILRSARRVLPSLFQFANNSYLLVSKSREALLIDPPVDTKLTGNLLAEIGHPTITAATATHYHGDHSEGLRYVRAPVWLHPWVVKPLRSNTPEKFIFMPTKPVRADHLWPERGQWRWNEYEFQIAPFPGQTWWHCTFMTNVDGQKVMFGGDSFQPASRWNATGGFCSRNNSRFEGFVQSAQLVLRWRPDILATGHRTYYRFHASQFRKIVRWARQAEAATKALCPTGSLERDYYLHSK